MDAAFLLNLIAQTTTAAADSGTPRNNFALVLMSLGVFALAGVALGAPRLAKRINARHERNQAVGQSVQAE